MFEYVKNRVVVPEWVRNKIILVPSTLLFSNPFVLSWPWILFEYIFFYLESALPGRDSAQRREESGLRDDVCVWQRLSRPAWGCARSSWFGRSTFSVGISQKVPRYVKLMFSKETTVVGTCPIQCNSGVEFIWHWNVAFTYTIFLLHAKVLNWQWWKTFVY
jgi:hypothetical protein